MSELRDRIAEALYAHNARDLGFELPDHKGRTAVPWELLPAGAKGSWYPRVDAILALPGIAVVELPEISEWPKPGCPRWDFYPFVRVEHDDEGEIVLGEGADPYRINIIEARNLAAALLAAAEYAEKEAK